MDFYRFLAPALFLSRCWRAAVSWERPRASAGNEKGISQLLVSDGGSVPYIYNQFGEHRLRQAGLNAQECRCQLNNS